MFHTAQVSASICISRQGQQTAYSMPHTIQYPASSIQHPVSSLLNLHSAYKHQLTYSTLQDVPYYLLQRSIALCIACSLSCRTVAWVSLMYACVLYDCAVRVRASQYDTYKTPALLALARH